MSNTKSKLNHKWKLSDNTYMDMADMTDDHIQQAIFYSEHRIFEWHKKMKEAVRNMKLFKQKRDELFEEASSRVLEVDSMEKSGTPIQQQIIDSI